jgi:hypothetical protein
MTNPPKNQPPNADRPASSYWEDPVYGYLSRRHRDAMVTNDQAAITNLDTLLQALVNQTLTQEQYAELDATAKAAKKKRKLDKKTRRTSVAPHPKADYCWFAAGLEEKTGVLS